MDKYKKMKWIARRIEDKVDRLLAQAPRGSACTQPVTALRYGDVFKRGSLYYYTLAAVEEDGNMQVLCYQIKLYGSDSAIKIGPVWHVAGGPSELRKQDVVVSVLKK